MVGDEMKPSRALYILRVFHLEYNNNGLTVSENYHGARGNGETEAKTSKYNTTSGK